MHGTFDPPAPLGFGRYLAGAGGVVAVLFAVLDPSPSAGLSLMARLLFWLLHIYGGLAILVLVQNRLDHISALRRRPWLAVSLAGLTGSLLFAPLALSLEGLFGQEEDFDGKGAEQLARGGFVGELLSETSEIAPTFVVTWIVLQLPWLLRLSFRNPAAARPEAEPELVAEPEFESESTPEAEPELESQPRSAPGVNSDFFTVLPEALGQDIAALTSELHYLRVKTPRGSALVLYNLKDAIADLETHLAGLQVHRSHWVARDHVRRLVRRGSGWACELSTGDLIPISRRKARLAREIFGEIAEYRPGI